MSAKPYAAETSVPVEKSRLEIEQILRRYDADAFGYSTDRTRATIAFRIGGRHVRFIMTMPDPAGDEFWIYFRGSVKYRRDAGPAAEKWEQACRQKWRALALVIKAKLEAVSAGITTVEDEFLAHTVLWDGRTVSEEIQPKLTEHYRIGGPANLMIEGPK